MRGKFQLAALSVLLGTFPALADQTTPVQGIHNNNPSVVALTNATIITEPGERIENATLVVQDGLIQSIERSNRAPSGARVVDATGYTVYPGFIDAYSNYGVEQPGDRPRGGRSNAPVYTNERQGGNASNAAVHAEQQWFETVTPDASEAQSYVQHGFTSVQSVRMDGIFRGRTTTLSLADKLPNDIIYNAVGHHAASFDKGSSSQQYPNSLMGSIALIRQTLSDAAWYAEAAGLNTLQGPVEFNSALDSLKSLNSERVIFEASDDLNLLRARRVFAEFSVPFTGVGSGFEYSRIDEIKAADLDLILPVNFPAAPEMGDQFSELDVSLADLRHWERAPANAAALEQAQVRFSFTMHGLDNKRDFWKNIRKAVDYGLSERQALAALTTIPAAQAGVSGQVGRISPGYRADFVVARGNLFEDGEIVSVWLQGEEQEIGNMHPVSFSGEYAMSLFDHDLSLTVSDSGRVSATLKISEDEEISVRDARVEDDKLKFLADLSALDMPGTYRFELERETVTTLAGRAQSAGGALDTIVATSTANDEESSASEQNSGDAQQPVEFVSRLTYPNVGFGRESQPEQMNLHIRNATIWTADDQGVLENADMLVRDGRIHRIGRDLSTPRGYEVIDATGMHVTPGMVDEHSHIAISQGVNEGTEAVTAEVRIGDVVNPDDIHIYRSLAGGTTVAHLLHGSANPIGGQGQAIKLRWGESAEGLKFDQTPPTIKMALGENVKQSNWGDLYTARYPQTRMGVAAIMRDYFQTAQEYTEAQEQYADLSRSERRRTAPPRTNYRLQALAEILQGERFTHVHSYVASEVLSLLTVAEDLGFRIQTFTHILEGYKVAEELAEHGAGASTFADWWAFKFEAYDAIPFNACLMMEQGVLTSINSDSRDLQRRLNTEAAKSVRYCDMDEHEALKMATIYPAMQLRIDEYVGSLTPGKHADFVIWNEHPLSAYAQPQQTWIEGRKYFDRSDDLAQRALIAEEREMLIEAVLNAGQEAHRGARGGYRQAQPEWHCNDNHDVWLEDIYHSHALEQATRELH
ncbi:MULTISPECIES: amidohydrolase family protein [Gammaproteobacteria]|uniref:amidohydrolase family protein n=1 Tax=Gammaproteobacteria TaxID=1236 RepID=UPI000DD07ED8|nr:MULTISPECIES: amidohydrolase family protein [Gammaproteobacteria]RTE87542.1 amidohydrolase [Aliidiomarina sp. B3213]TCZ92673.1 amidohydrolase [Lysobacter sp. N42]